jgi:hypothetical protein
MDGWIHGIFAVLYIQSLTKGKTQQNNALDLCQKDEFITFMQGFKDTRVLNLHQ